MKTNVLIQGDIGTGKTRSIMTLLPKYIDERGEVHRGAGQEVFMIPLEAGTAATLGPNICGSAPGTSPISPPIHYHYIAPVAITWDQAANFVKLANSLPMDNFIKAADPSRRSYQQFVEVYATCANFTCDACGQSFGDVAEWDDTRTLVIDGLTGLTKVAQQNVVGGRPILSLPEYGAIQALLNDFLDLFWGATKCSAVMLAHTENETNPLTGLSVTTVSTIGKALAPKILKKPDEVIASVEKDGKFLWSTEPISNERQKRRRLPASSTLPADFSVLFK